MNLPRGRFQHLATVGASRLRATRVHNQGIRAIAPTEESWPHFRPSAVDFCGSRLAIGAATERARAPASARERAPKPYKRDSSGVAPASPQVAYPASPRARPKKKL